MIHCSNPIKSNILSALFLKKFKELAVKRVYVIRPVLEFEACGFDVTSGLHDVFVQPLKLDVVEE